MVSVNQHAREAQKDTPPEAAFSDFLLQVGPSTKKKISYERQWINPLMTTESS